jgi:preprotein translocase subunit SecA
MLPKILKRFFISSNERIVKSLIPLVSKINSMEESLKILSDSELAGKTVEFKSRLNSGETLDNLLPEAFAVVRETSKRCLGMRHFDMQMVGGIIIHREMISEMKTGEGKTLAATLPIYLNALTGKGVHLVTVNDYLVKRDADWMGKIYKFLGLTVGCIISNLSEEERKAAYSCDITYGTNNEFGFDYLRDNLKHDTNKMVQREFNFAIVDEVDSVLIDEARTPLIISGPTEDNSDLYLKINKLIPSLGDMDFEVDEKSKTVMLTDAGNENIEKTLSSNGIIKSDTGLYDFENMSIVHYVNQALKAHKLFKKDVDYIVKNGKIMIIDEFTGRIMDGRRYSEGLHQALEAKEGVAIQNENQTLASITFQNYFRMYPKLSGMTGTAITEQQEFFDIYKLESVAIPTHVLIQRKDEDDEIYLSAKEKYDAIISEIEKAHLNGQPILVGTVSIDKSEYLSSMLKKRKIKHNVLNARYHEQEARIISQAGKSFAVTIATNMAGRGTDIVLGGNATTLLNEKLSKGNFSDKEYKELSDEIVKLIEEDKKKVLSSGGLLVIGTERHESRRIDNQLRGRSGRQGDPGRTKFYLSLEDDLMRIFGSEKIKGLLSKLGLKEGEAIIHPWISKSLEKAQQKVEARNYDVRKTLLKFDDVMNEQRKVIYDQRKYFMNATDLDIYIKESALEALQNMIVTHIPRKSTAEERDMECLSKELFGIFSIKYNGKEEDIELSEEEFLDKLHNGVTAAIDNKLIQYDSKLIGIALKQLLILTLDQLWKEHLHVLDHLRTGIGLRSYAQKDPLNEYKIEAFNLFKKLMLDFTELSVRRFSYLEIAHEVKEVFEEPKSNKVFETRNDPTLLIDNRSSMQDLKIRKVIAKVNLEDRDKNDISTWGKVSRNEECPCGSGKKYKHCHGSF